MLCNVPKRREGAARKSWYWNNRVLLVAIASRVLLCGVFLETLGISAFGANEPSYTPPAIVCEVRYYFREHLRGANEGEKSVSAPSYEREVLPRSQLVISDGSASRIVEGTVAHLPYRFLVKLTRNSDADRGTLEVNVLDTSGKPLQSFPQAIASPFTKTEESSRQDFEVPVSEALSKTLEKTLLAKDQFLTYVDLTIGTGQ